VLELNDGLSASNSERPEGVTQIVESDRAETGAPAGGEEPPAQGRAVHQALLDPAVQARLLAAATTATPTPPPAELPDELTPREAEVLRLIARGMSNAEIAAALVVSEATVKSHINHLFAKISSRDRAQAVHYAYTHGLAD
jgi:DNA-binding NarL/FixJ family response regulator